MTCAGHSSSRLDVSDDLRGSRSGRRCSYHNHPSRCYSRNSWYMGLQCAVGGAVRCCIWGFSAASHISFLVTFQLTVNCARTEQCWRLCLTTRRDPLNISRMQLTTMFLGFDIHLGARRQTCSNILWRCTVDQQLDQFCATRLGAHYRRTPQQARDSKWYIAEERAVTPIREIERQEREEVDRAVAAAAAVCIFHFSKFISLSHSFHSKPLQWRCGPARAHAGTAADHCFAHMLKLVGVGTVRAACLLPSERVIITRAAYAALRRRMRSAIERQSEGMLGVRSLRRRGRVCAR